jgi:hypothetical protein
MDEILDDVNESFDIGVRLVLDSKRLNMKRRAQIGFLIVMIPTLVSFCWLVANQVKFIHDPPGKMDWTASGWANAYVPFYMMQILGYMCQTVSHRTKQICGRYDEHLTMSTCHH